MTLCHELKPRDGSRGGWEDILLLFINGSQHQLFVLSQLPKKKKKRSYPKKKLIIIIIISGPKRSLSLSFSRLAEINPIHQPFYFVIIYSPTLLVLVLVLLVLLLLLLLPRKLEKIREIVNMGMMEGLEGLNPTTMAPALLRNMIISAFVHADKLLLNLSKKYKPLQVVRYLIISSFLFILRLLPFVFHSLKAQLHDFDFPINPPKNDNLVPVCGCGDSGIARALSQLLLIVNDIPVSSRKYEFVRSLAERLIDENHRENSMTLNEVNRAVLSAAFARALCLLEASVEELENDRAENGYFSAAFVSRGLNRIMRTVRSLGERKWSRVGKEGKEERSLSAEKLSAELLWLAQKMAACGFGEEAVGRWASASHLAWLSVSAEPRLQGSLLKIAGTSVPFNN